MKILIYGLKGWIGQQFEKLLIKNNLTFIEGKTRVDDVNQLENEINTYNPTHIISFIGRTHGHIKDKYFSTIDYLEQPGKLVNNINDNLFAPITLAIICKNLNIHFTYLGTGCIFKFDNDHPFGKEINGFTEDDLPNFFGSSYSIVKGYTDRLMSLFDKTTLNLRIRMPITDEQHHRNFITKITTYEKICSIPNSMSVLPELLPIIIDMIQKKITGTFNLTNPGLISHNQILEMFKNIVDPSFQWQNFNTEEQSKILVSERSNNYLDVSKLLDLYPNIKNIKESISDCLVRYKKTYIANPTKLIPMSISTKRINLLITGGCGFIASNFINRIFNQNIYNIINIDALYYCSNIDNVDSDIQASKYYTFIKGNIRSADLISFILTNYKIEQVIHFAAQSHVDNSFENSMDYTQDNIIGTHNLLECCRKYNKITKFIHVSTDEVYGESETSTSELSKTEHSVLCPTNPYASSKAGAELIAQSYLHSYKLPLIITRGNNVYGPNQYPEKLIPKFITLLNNNKKVTIQGDGSSLRGFVHSYDVSNAFDLILKKGVIGEIYNIGCEQKYEYTVLEVAKILIRLIKNTDNFDEWIEYVQDRPFNDKRYYINNKKIINLGWKPTIEFISGVKDLIQYYSTIS